MSQKRIGVDMYGTGHINHVRQEHFWGKWTMQVGAWII